MKGNETFKPKWARKKADRNKFDNISRDEPSMTKRTHGQFSQYVEHILDKELEPKTKVSFKTQTSI